MVFHMQPANQRSCIEADAPLQPIRVRVLGAIRIQQDPDVTQAFHPTAPQPQAKEPKAAARLTTAQPTTVPAPLQSTTKLPHTPKLQLQHPERIPKMATTTACPIVGTTNDVLPPNHPDIDLAKDGQTCPVVGAKTDHHHNLHKHPNVPIPDPASPTATECPALKNVIQQPKSQAMDDEVCPVRTDACLLFWGGEERRCEKGM